MSIVSCFAGGAVIHRVPEVQFRFAEMFLQTHVVPVCLYAVDGRGANIRELVGTAFFINGHGAFLTARHVIEGAEISAGKKDLSVGLVVKAERGQSGKSLIAPVVVRSFAPTPYDIAIGKVSYECPTLFGLKDLSASEWQDVAAYGYPLNAVSGDPSGLNLNLRCHKGYIQRLIRPGDLPVGNHPAAFELSFLLSPGLSGCPLFVHSQPKDTVIGVCVGSIRSEIVDDAIEEVVDGDRTYREKRLKIEQYGVAHDLRPLLGWRPSQFDGLSLLDISIRGDI